MITDLLNPQKNAVIYIDFQPRMDSRAAIIDRRPLFGNVLPPANSARMLKEQVIALHRYGTGNEIASLVAYLAGPEAGYVTGASLSIDGGFTA
jgi:NAD(P)-dependent dehydrogenase (short-subunit alcohol dehydrogenase family)